MQQHFGSTLHGTFFGLAILKKIFIYISQCPLLNACDYISQLVGTRVQM
jgi:hypothetical protein